MLMMVEKVIRGGICHAIHRHVKANNKYMENYDKSIKSSYLIYLDKNNLYGWAMFQKLPVNDFKCKKHVSIFDEQFIKNYNEDNNKGYITEVDVEYPKYLHNLYSDLPFLSERMKIKKCNKLACNLYDKKEYVVHIRALKQALNHGPIFKKIHRVIQFNQEAWLKPCIETSTKLRTEAKNDFEQDFFRFMNNSVFGKNRKCKKAYRYLISSN